MAVVMKQLDRSQEAIEAISSFRGLCSKQSQESLDNVLIDLYKVLQIIHFKLFLYTNNIYVVSVKIS